MQNNTLNIFDLPVHPSADLFPMIPKDELEELADDIKENGLIHPIVLKDGVLIDGRNRREACRIAEIDDIAFVEFEGNIDSYIISSNINRRHMTSGQRSMAFAMIKPEGESGGRGNKLSRNRESLDLSKTERNNVSTARKILKHSRLLADQVLAGHVTLNTAKESIISEEEKEAKKNKQALTLKEEYPDLHTKVIEEQITLEEAWTLYLSKKAKRDAVINGMNLFLKDLILSAKSVETNEAIDRHLINFNECGDKFNHHTIKNIDDAMAEVVNLSDGLLLLIKGYYNEQS